MAERMLVIDANDHNDDTNKDNDPKNSSAESLTKPVKSKSRRRDKEFAASAKRRCCDGNTPSCAACASVYGTDCIYDPNSDHRRKGVYKKDIDNLKTRNSTLQTLIQAILNYPENEVPELVRQIRSCESLDDVAESILSKENPPEEDGDDTDSPIAEAGTRLGIPKFEAELSGKMGELRLENGSVSFIGGTSNLIYIESDMDGEENVTSTESLQQYRQHVDPVTSWTEVTSDPELVDHLLNMYFAWHYTCFTTLSKSLFYRDFLLGRPSQTTKRKTEYCTELLVNTMLALGCHFTSWPAARADPNDSATAGDHFFKEAKRLILENDEHENPRLATVQALALMSVREAGCGREARGWIYSGMSFRMAYDVGLNVDSGSSSLEEEETDARRITIWGCFLFDKCWSNYLGRQPQLPLSSIAVPKFDVFPTEDADIWSPYLDSGVGQAHSQPSRTRAAALQISQLCEISSDLLLYFYHPTHLEKPLGKQAELKKLGELHTRLEAWRKNLPKEMDAKEGQLPHVLVMHMFFQLLFIHLFRPFLKYKQATSPLPAHVSPRKFCTHAAATISKLLRLYKRTHGLRQICNIAVYIAHSACTIHLLNLPEKNATRDIIHGVKHLEEIAESWLCARRTLGILQTVSRRWKIELPEEAAKVLLRSERKFGPLKSQDQHSPRAETSPQLTSPRVASFHPNLNNHDPPTLSLPINTLFPTISPVFPTGASSAIPPETGPLPLPPNPAIEYDRKTPRLPQSYMLPQVQQELWNQDRASRGSSGGVQTSPSVLFGGVPALLEDSGEWWLKDHQTFFANWNGVDQHHGQAGDAGLLASVTNNGTCPVGYGIPYATINGDDAYGIPNPLL